MLLTVLNYLCDFFSCKHLSFLARRYLAWNKFATCTSPVAYLHLIIFFHTSFIFIGYLIHHYEISTNHKII